MGFEPKPGGPQEGPRGIPSPGPPGARAPPLSGGCTPLCGALIVTDTVIIFSLSEGGIESKDKPRLAQGHSQTR